VTVQRAEVVSLFAELRTTEPVIVGPGSTSGALYQADHRSPTIYNMDMGYAAAICLGLALAVPAERVVALEGDGSVLAGLGVLSTIGRYRPPNLVLVVFHNGVYASCGDGQVRTAADATTDLPAVARACGIDADKVVTIETVDAARKALSRALTEPGPWVLVMSIEQPDRWPSGRPLPRHDLVETAVAFKREMMRRGYRSGGQAS
jgi:sulfopyruvate decarboxylase subunit beta